MKGMMAEIGKRTGVATLFGIKVHGFLAWWLWRTYYLSNLPTIKKKLKVIGDWTMDLIYTPDVAMIKKQIIFADEDQIRRAGTEEGKKEQHDAPAKVKEEVKKSNTDNTNNEGSNEEEPMQRQKRK
jgi:hypothetical protein